MDNWFTYLVGAATVIGLVVQFAQLVPQYRSQITKAIFALAGLFVGSFIEGVQVQNATIDFSGSLLDLSVIILQFGFGALAFYMIWKHTNDGRDYTAAFMGCALMFFLLFIYHGASSLPARTNDDDRLQLQEWRILAERAEDKQNYDRAVWLYRKVKARLDNREQTNELQRKIDELIAKSAGLQN